MMSFMDEFIILELPPSMRHLKCMFCDKNEPPCEWFIKDRTKANSWAPMHQVCFHAWLEEGERDNDQNGDIQPAHA